MAEIKKILVRVEGQNIEAENIESVKGTKGLIHVVFSFDESWSDYNALLARFKNSNSTKSYTADIINGECEIPKECLQFKGFITMAVEGENPLGQVERTNAVLVVSQKDTIAKGYNEINPTPSQYEQFIQLAGNPNWDAVQDKPFSKVGNGLNIKDDTIYWKMPDFESLNKREDWLYEIVFSTCDYDYAYNAMESKFPPINNSACTAVYKDGLFGKNFDWYYSWNLEFVVRSRASNGKYASTGIMGGFPPFTKQLLESREYVEDFKIIPFMISDGLNEKGVFVGLNVVPFKETKGGEVFTIPTTGTNPQSLERPICALMLPKFILDNFDSAEQAVNDIRDKYSIYATNTEKLQEEYHLFVGDKNKRFILEFINNETKVIDVTNNIPWMTNFYRYEAEFYSNGTAKYKTLTDHAMGVERSNIIARNYDSIVNADDMIDLMMNKLKYTKAYSAPWLDELCGVYKSFGDLTIKDVYEHPEKFDEVLAIFKSMYEHRDRDTADTWLSAHSCVYDINNGYLYITVQENGIIHKIDLNDYEETIWTRGTGKNSAQLKGTGCRAEGINSVAEGLNTVAASDYSHAEGYASKTAIDPDDENHGQASHAEGTGTVAKGNSSHAEGGGTLARGADSHAEGNSTTTMGGTSHAEGNWTITNNFAEHAQGTFNLSNMASSTFGDPGNTLHSIGIGKATGELRDDRRNAVEVMQNGDSYIIGIGNYDGTNFAEATTIQDIINNLLQRIEELENK